MTETGSTPLFALPPLDRRVTPTQITFNHRRDPDPRPQRQELHDHPAARAGLTSTPFDISHLVAQQQEVAHHPVVEAQEREVEVEPPARVLLTWTRDATNYGSHCEWPTQRWFNPHDGAAPNLSRELTFDVYRSVACAGRGGALTLPKAHNYEETNVKKYSRGQDVRRIHRSAHADRSV